jgi:hypothetical protein
MDKQAVLEKSKDSSTNDNEQDQVAREKLTLYTCKRKYWPATANGCYFSICKPSDSLLHKIDTFDWQTSQGNWIYSSTLIIRGQEF